MSTDANEHVPDMGAIKRIVVGVDGSDHSMRALEWAAAQAQRSHAALEILAALDPGAQFLTGSDDDQRMQDELDEAKLRAHSRAPEIAVTSTTCEGPPELVLTKESAEADLLVVGSRGRGGFKGLLLGSVSRKCVQHSKCPVVVVLGASSEPDEVLATGNDTPTLHEDGVTTRSEEQRDSVSPVGSAHRIVVGVDGSVSSIQALEWAADQAELTGVGLDALITWEWPAGYGWSPVPTSYDPDHENKVALDALLEPVRKAHPGLSIHATVIEGHPAPVLVRASHGADLLVVGSRGRGEIAGMLLGSVSEHCVAHAQCPVVVLHGGK